VVDGSQSDHPPGLGGFQECSFAVPGNYPGRSTDPSWPRIAVLQKLLWMEPPVLRMGLVCRDAQHWFGFSRVLGVSRAKAILLFPIALLASFFARTAEMIGMCAALLAPKATEHQARF
jgi:hypothetical protein